MLLKLTINLDDEQVKERLPLIEESVVQAVEGALYNYRDGLGRHSCVINFEVLVEREPS